MVVDAVNDARCFGNQPVADARRLANVLNPQRGRTVTAVETGCPSLN